MGLIERRPQPDRLTQVIHRLFALALSRQDVGSAQGNTGVVRATAPCLGVLFQSILRLALSGGNLTELETGFVQVGSQPQGTFN